MALVVSDQPLSTRSATLVFEPVGTDSGVVPELEFWAAGDQIRPEAADLASDALPPDLFAFKSTTEEITIAPDSCASLPVRISRGPAAFRRAHLVYETTGVFRPFALGRSVNGRGIPGTSWSTPDPSTRTFVEEIDPALLTLGANDVRICVPDSFTEAIRIKHPRIVGELDRGFGFATNVAIGTDRRAGAAMIDGDPTTASSVQAGEAVRVDLERLVAPDIVTLTSRDPSVVPRIDCIDSKGSATPLEVAAESTGTRLLVAGGHLACASLVMTFDRPAEVAELDIVGSGAAEIVDWPRLVVTSPTEHFGSVAWVAGFVTRPTRMTGTIRTEVDSHSAEGIHGEFGRLVERSTLGDTWTVGVRAVFPDGTDDPRSIVLDRDHSDELSRAKADHKAALDAPKAPNKEFGNEGESVAGPATHAKPSSIRLGTRVGIDLPQGAVRGPTNITVRHLGKKSLPPLDPGMINVTAPKGHGYEFLPHGQKFAKPAEVVVPFDPTLIPKDMSVDDVFTFYYDTKTRRWRKLERAAIDLRDHVTRSRTDHFTIMIDAVLAAPSNPTPLSFDPTAISSMPAASPAAGIDLIAPPSANSSGDASTALPLRLPPGRGAHTPSLSVTYSSSGTSGWVGVGWDLSISKIEIDTRMGVPTYAASEEPRYLLDGAELVPTMDTDGPTCSGARRYHMRIEGSFAHILRCGTSPSTYHFEVRDRDGTKFTYGAGGNSTVVNPKPIGGIFRWNLRTVEDVHRNTTTYSYAVDSQAGSANVEPFVEVYPDSIDYTSHQPSGLAAKYRVEFVPAVLHRFDMAVSGRAGFKMVSRKLLRSVRVKYQSQLVREYLFTYRAGAFDKTLLSSVRQYGTSGCSVGSDPFQPPSCGTNEFHEHSFDYFSGPAQNGFGPTEPWPVEGIPPGAMAPGDPHSNPSLGRGKADTWSYGLSVGAELPGGSASAGFHATHGARGEHVGFYDVNSDGLVDQLFDFEGRRFAFFNRYDPNGLGSSRFETSPALSISGLPFLGRESNHGWGVNAKIGIGIGQLGASASGGLSNSTSRASRLFTDIDGDGRIDLIANSSLFSSACPSGICFSAGAVSDPSIDPTQDPLLQDYATEIQQRLPTAAPVVRWVAPYSGTVTLSGPISLVTTGTTDGVSIGAYHDDTALGSWTLNAGAPNATINIQNIQVVAGEGLYLRATTGAHLGIDGTTLRDEVNAPLVVTYTEACLDIGCTSTIIPPTAPGTVPKDPNARRLHRFELEHEMRVNATQPFRAPVAGRLVIKGRFENVFPGPRSALRVCVQKFPAGTLNTEDVSCAQNWEWFQDLPYGGGNAQIGNALLPLRVDVEKDDLIVVRADSNYSFEPGWQRLLPQAASVPFIAYEEACIPDDSHFGCSLTVLAEDLDDIPVDLSSFGLYNAPATPPEPFGTPPRPFVSPAAGIYTIHRFPNPLGQQAIAVAIRTDYQQPHIFQCAASALCDSTTISLSVGESLSVEIYPLQGALLLPPLIDHVAIGGFAPSMVPIIFRERTKAIEDVRPFAGTYRGWGTTFWNESVLFAPKTLLDTYADPSSIDTPQEALELSLTAFTPVPDLDGSLPSNIPLWRAPGSQAFVSQRARLHAASLGGSWPQPPVDPAEPTPDGGLFAPGYKRLSGTSTRFITLGVGLPPIGSFLSLSFDVTVSKSETDTTTDVADLNGDGVADTMTPVGLRLGALSSAPSTLVPAMSTGAALRRRSGREYSLGFSGSPVAPRTTSTGRRLGMTVLSSNEGGAFSISTSVGLGIGRGQTTEDMVDVNGDGLPDRVQRNGDEINVRYNLGTSFGVLETIGTVRGAALTTDVDGFEQFESTNPLGISLDSTSNALTHETTLTQHRVTTVDLWLFSYTRSRRTTASRTTRQFADINGDGLPDLLLKRGDASQIIVQINRGSTFDPATATDSFDAPTTWNTTSWNGADLDVDFHSNFASITDAGNYVITGPDVLSGTGSQESSSNGLSLSLPLPVPPPLEAQISGNAAKSTDQDTYELALLDIDGDGAADRVFRRGGSNPAVLVQRNLVDTRTNLLERIHRPLHGTITIGYGIAKSTPDMPQRRNVLARVEIDDGIDLGVDFASPNTATQFEYLNGKYDRHEKSFLGFSTVFSKRVDASSNPTVLSMVEHHYNNDEYALRGQLLREVVRGQANEIFSERVITYEVRNVTGNTGTLGVHPACVDKPLVVKYGGGNTCVPRWPIATKVEETRYEIVSAPSKTRTTRDDAHDRFGNVTNATDSGDAAFSSDDLVSVVMYQNDTTSWILGRPTQITVANAGTTLRSRTGTYQLGKLESLGVVTGTGTAVTTFGYDEYGNLEKTVGPPNHQGQQQTINILYDASVRTYPEQIEDVTCLLSVDQQFRGICPLAG